MARRWTGLVALFFVATGLSLLLWMVLPTLLLDWKPIAISSGSMAPGIRRGDVVVTERFDPWSLGHKQTLDIGTVVVFGNKVDPGRVTHRILAVTPDGAYVTKGDANPRRDSTPVESWQIVGVGKLLVPMIGQPVAWMHDGQMVHLAGFGLAALAALWLTPAAFAPVPMRTGRGGIGTRLPAPVGRVLAWTHRGRRLIFAATFLAGSMAIFGAGWLAFGEVPRNGYALACGAAAWAGLEVFGGRRKTPAATITPTTAPAVLTTAAVDQQRRAMFATGVLSGLVGVFVMTWLSHGLAPHLGAFAMVGITALWWSGRALLRPVAAPRVPSPAELAEAAARRRRRVRLASYVLAGLVAAVAMRWAGSGEARHAIAFAMAGAVVVWAGTMLATHSAGSPFEFVAGAAARHPRAMFTTGALVGLIVVLQGFGVSNALFAFTTDNFGNRLAAAAHFAPLHLHDWPTPPVGDTNYRRRLGMDVVVPTATVLYNYDVNRDPDPGLRLLRSDRGLLEERRDRAQIWLNRGPHIINGPVTFDFWSAMQDFDTADRGLLLAGLYECRNNGGNCTQIASQALDLDPWDTFATGTWVEHTIDFGTVVHNVPANRSLVIKLVVSDVSDADMHFAYNTVQYDSRLTLP